MSIGQREPESHKNSEHQTRGGVGKMHCVYGVNMRYVLSVYGARRLWWWRNTSNGANEVVWFIRRTCGRNTWLLNLPKKPKRKGVKDSQSGGFCLIWKTIWPQRRFKRSKKLRKTVLSSNTVMPISFETLRRGTQWLIIKTEEAPGSNDRRSEAMAGRTGRKPPPGWRRRSPKYEMVLRG